MAIVENYDFFLFTQLYQEVNGKSTKEYDLLFPMLLQEFHRFEESKWNVESKPLYECILDYLNRPKYLGLTGTTGHSADAVDRYNALLEMLQPAGILMQVERWMDAPQSDSLVRFIEANLMENDIDLPY
jgi:hypothetical protein